MVLGTGLSFGLMNHSYRVVLPEKRDPRPYAGSRIWRYMYTFIYLYTLYPERRYSVEHWRPSAILTLRNFYCEIFLSALKPGSAKIKGLHPECLSHNSSLIYGRT